MVTLFCATTQQALIADPKICISAVTAIVRSEVIQEPHLPGLGSWALGEHFVAVRPIVVIWMPLKAEHIQNILGRVKH